MSRAPLLFVLALLAGCGSLPRPFEGNPGAVAMRLAAPPPARLAVPVPTASLLPERAATIWADAVTEALVSREVPAVMRTPRAGDWRLVLSAELRAGSVVPSYAVQNPKGEEQGATSGPPMPAAAWAGGDPRVLRAAALAAAPDIAELLTRIEAARRESDPNSLVNRPPRVWFAGVHGAPGDGNQSLARRMRARLAPLGEVVQDTPQGADFELEGKVAAVPVAGGKVRVELQWIVTDASGREAGRVVQINEVPARAVSGYWGDVADAAAEQAAGGVREVILNQTGARRDRPKAPPGAPAATPAGASGAH